MNILSIDLEEWFTYEFYKKGEKTYYEPILEKYLEEILDLFDKKRIKVTFFCLGIIARTHSHIIKKIAERGHEIGCHSDKHNFITEFSPEEFKIDTQLAIDSLEQVISKKVTMYRAPAFTITEKNKWAIDTLIDCGIKYDSSIFPTQRSYGGFASYEGKYPAIIESNSGYIKEFPMSYSEILGKRIVFTGGGYFRLFPYYFVSNLMKKSDYNMAYFHLRDFDKDQKKIYSLRYFKTYYGISNALSKFEKLLEDFDFISLGEASEKIDWESAVKIKI